MKKSVKVLYRKKKIEKHVHREKRGIDARREENFQREDVQR